MKSRIVLWLSLVTLVGLMFVAAACQTATDESAATETAAAESAIAETAAVETASAESAAAETAAAESAIAETAAVETAAVETAAAESAIAETAAAESTTGETAQVAADNPLVGIWIQSRSDFYLQFTADGTYSLATLFDDLEKFPAMSGTYTYEDPVLTLNANPDPPNRQYCMGETASYTVVLDPSGEFVLVDLDFECFNFNILSGKNSGWSPYNP